MPARVDDLALGLRVAAPEQKDQPFALAVEDIDHMVGEAFPAAALVATGLSFLDREHRIEQQHPLPCPRHQVAVGRTRQAEVTVQFLVDVVERRWHRDTRQHREAQAMRLAGTVIGVLAEDHHLDRVERRGVEGGKDVFRLGMDACPGMQAFAQEDGECAHVFALQPVADARLP